MAGPNGGSKKVKSIGLSNLDNKNLVICVDELTLTAVNQMVVDFESTVGIDIEVNAKVSTPMQLIMSGDWMRSNVVIAWIDSGTVYMAPMDLIVTNGSLFTHAFVTTGLDVSHIFGRGDTWTTTTPFN